jgi:hypothetical protein
MRLHRKGLMLLPQVTLNEIVLPLAIETSPAEATTTAVVKGAMKILLEVKMRVTLVKCYFL